MTENNSLEAAEVATSEAAEDVKQEVEQGSEEPQVEEAVEGDAPVAEEPEVELSADALEWKTKYEKIQEATQKRFDRKTAANRQLQEELDSANKRLAEFEKSSRNPEDNAPKEEDFDSWDEYQDAVIQHRAETLLQQKEQERLQAEQQAKQVQMYEAQQKQYNERVEAFKATKPDFHDKETVVEEIVADAMRNGVTPAIEMLTQAVLQSENSARIVYELGENPEVLENMLNMTPYEAVRELVKLESKPVDIVKEKTLPKPIKNNSGTTKTNKSIKNMSSDEFKARFM